MFTFRRVHGDVWTFIQKVANSCEASLLLCISYNFNTLAYWLGFLHVAVYQKTFKTHAAGLKVAHQTYWGSWLESGSLLSMRFFIMLRLSDYRLSEQTDFVLVSVLMQRFCKSAITAFCCCFSLLYRPWISPVSVCLWSTWVLVSPVILSYPSSTLPRQTLLVEARVAWIGISLSASFAVETFSSLEIDICLLDPSLIWIFTPYQSR